MKLTPKNGCFVVAGAAMTSITLIVAFVAPEHLLGYWRYSIALLAFLSYFFLIAQAFQQSEEDITRDKYERRLTENVVDIRATSLLLLTRTNIRGDIGEGRLSATSEPIPLFAMTGYQFLWTKPDDNNVFRTNYQSGSKSLLFVFANTRDSKDEGSDAHLVRANISFEYRNGSSGANMFPAPWLDHAYSFIDMPLGTENKVIVGVFAGKESGWNGYKYKRSDASWNSKINPIEAVNPLPTEGRLKIVLIANVGNRSVTIFQACFSWREDMQHGHVWIEQIPCKEFTQP